MPLRRPSPSTPGPQSSIAVARHRPADMEIGPGERGLTPCLGPHRTALLNLAKTLTQPACSGQRAVHGGLAQPADQTFAAAVDVQAAADVSAAALSRRCRHTR